MSTQIWTDSDYVYVVTSSGLEIYDLTSQLLGATAYNINGYSSVWASDNYIYIGTFSAGIKKLYKPSIVIDVVAPTNINDYIIDYFKYPDITSDTVNYIHGNYNKLLVCTTAGVDIIRTDSLYITHHYTTPDEEPLKCFSTDTDGFYYTVVSGISSTYYLYRLDGNKSNWNESNYSYMSGFGILSSIESVMDIYVTDGTSISGSNYNTVFLTTNSGVYVIDEGSGDYVIFTTV
jgi:hypothetical protein